MSSQPNPITTLPPHAAPRLQSNLQALLTAAREALAAPQADPAQHPRWTDAAALLAHEHAACSAATPLAAAGDAAPLLALAERLCQLARTLDGYPLDFAGPAFAARLETSRRLTVLTAWQILAHSRGSGATGL